MTTRRLVDPGVKRLWDQLEEQEYAIVVERRRLQDIWKQISAMHKANAEAREEFEKKAAFDFISPDQRVALNVGGHTFETTAGVLCRDRYSFLAAICKTSPPIEKDKEGAFFFDRDWWIFRYILHFLRTGDLPQDHALLREIYDEASFYRLNSLRRAAERRAAEAALVDVARQKPAEVRESVTSRQRWRSGEGAATSRPAPKPRIPDQRWRTAGAPGREHEAGASGRERAPRSNPYQPPLPDPYGFIRKY